MKGTKGKSKYCWFVTWTRVNGLLCWVQCSQKPSFKRGYCDYHSQVMGLA